MALVYYNKIPIYPMFCILKGDYKAFQQRRPWGEPSGTIGVFGFYYKDNGKENGNYYSVLG